GTAWNLLVLDRSPPGLDGLQICRKVRGSANYAPILMLDAQANELDLVLGLESGADDYIGKPLSAIEFAARAKAILRREHTVNSHINRLRAKLEPCPTRPRYIHTVWGVGYRLCPSPGAAQIRNCHP